MVYVCKNCGNTSTEPETCCDEEMMMDEFALDYEDDDA